MKLSKAPALQPIPESLVKKFWYDAERNELAFTGYMSKVEFDELVRLSRDLEYQRAMERLFQICTFDDATISQQRSWLKRLVAAVATVAVLAVAVAMLVLKI